MTQLTFGYSDSEDRLWLLFTDEGTQLWLTRRLMGALLTHMVKHITDSVPGALGVGSSLASNQRVALEHETAGEVWQAPGQAATASTPVNATYQLNTVNVHIDERQVKMEFVAPGYQRSLTLNRADAHQLLRAMAGRCLAADWNLPNLPLWLVDPVDP